jgi:hypothetical protein
MKRPQSECSHPPEKALRIREPSESRLKEKGIPIGKIKADLIKRGRISGLIMLPRQN